MKKIIIGLCLAFGVVTLNAQDEVTEEASSSSSSSTSGFLSKTNKDLSFTSKNGYEVLPQGGDWGIGIAANDPLEFVGSLFSNNGGSSNGGFSGVSNVSSTVTTGTTIYGKYFLNSHTAIRGFIGINNTRQVTITEVEDDGNPDLFVNDTETSIERNNFIGVGLEKRRGNGRLIGVYGAQAVLGFGGTDITKFDYANEISENNQAPNGDAGVVDFTDNERILETKDGSNFELGLRGFVGVEYFVAPRISIGGEFTLGVSYEPSSTSSTLVEYFDASSNSVEEFLQVNEGDRSRELNSFTNVFGGNINMFFYF